MANNKNEKLPKTEEVAERSFQAEDVHSSNEVEQGLATTHEQVSDTFVEGTIDGKIDDVEGEDIDLAKDGYSEDIFKDK
ncbi:YozQ family protein [Alkalihalobacillus deserti]|uniref:YozQ family protein n=1 Tax=Alkalihalobacillus deserti TaxID=2879466 RepID=UPI001D135ADC|nr:YozQ family protein [Alkalihalobacillus deserti]